MNELLNRLTDALNSRVAELATQIEGRNTSAQIPPMPVLLKAAMKNEWETTLLTSHWVIDEPDVELRVDLARLAGDEAKHFNMIKLRLSSLGESINPEELNERSPLFHFLKLQTDSFDRAVTGPFAREALAVARNQVFLDHCKNIKDRETIAVYDEIQADEEHHHRLGKKYLEANLQTEEQYQRAEKVMLEMLKIVDDIQEMVVLQKGICRIPGC